jgi:D-alanyl-D-alanine carboxypeptidase
MANVILEGAARYLASCEARIDRRGLLMGAFVLRTLLLGLVFVTLNFGLTAPAQAAGNSKYAAIVVHADSGDVLFNRYADARRFPASLTKMMTLYLLYEELEAGRLTLASDLDVSAQAAGQPPSKLGLTAGSTIDVDTAIKALVVKSANDVAVVVAEAISGTEWRFAQKMTEKARELGMSKTTFRNASGLPNSKQVTTARDLATLGAHLAHDFPQYFDYFSTKSFVWNGKTHLTHNSVVRTFEGADGLKTGYTRVSGFNLATSVNREGERLIGVVLGGRSVRTRDAHMKLILTEAYAQLKSNPTLIASLHRETPSPRLKPTLVAQLEREQMTPTVGGSDAVREEIAIAAAGFAPLGAPTAIESDAIGALIASASSDPDDLPDDLNEFQRAKLASLTPFEGNIGEGDTESQGGWSVQIGAFSTRSLAEQELESAAAAGALRDRPRTVQPMLDSAGREIYRARFTAMTSSEAAQVCDTLRTRSKISCFLISEPQASTRAE